jgi:hypothetical protein
MYTPPPHPQADAPSGALSRARSTPPPSPTRGSPRPRQLVALHTTIILEGNATMTRSSDGTASFSANRITVREPRELACVTPEPESDDESEAESKSEDEEAVPVTPTRDVRQPARVIKSDDFKVLDNLQAPATPEATPPPATLLAVRKPNVPAEVNQNWENLVRLLQKAPRKVQPEPMASTAKPAKAIDLGIGHLTLYVWYHLRVFEDMARELASRSLPPGHASLVVHCHTKNVRFALEKSFLESIHRETFARCKQDTRYRIVVVNNDSFIGTSSALLSVFVFFLHSSSLLCVVYSSSSRTTLLMPPFFSSLFLSFFVSLTAPGHYSFFVHSQARFFFNQYRFLQNRSRPIQNSPIADSSDLCPRPMTGFNAQEGSRPPGSPFTCTFPSFFFCCCGEL